MMNEMEGEWIYILITDYWLQITAADVDDDDCVSLYLFNLTDVSSAKIAWIEIGILEWEGRR